MQWRDPLERGRRPCDQGASIEIRGQTSEMRGDANARRTSSVGAGVCPVGQDCCVQLHHGQHPRLVHGCMEEISDTTDDVHDLSNDVNEAILKWANSARSRSHCHADGVWPLIAYGHQPDRLQLPVGCHWWNQARVKSLVDRAFPSAFRMRAPREPFGFASVLIA